MHTPRPQATAVIRRRAADTLPRCVHNERAGGAPTLDDIHAAIERERPDLVDDEVELPAARFGGSTILAERSRLSLSMAPLAAPSRWAMESIPAVEGRSTSYRTFWGVDLL